MNATKTVGIIAVIFYILCWFADQPTRTLYYIGIALPWLSLILSIPTGILCKVRDDKYFYLWGCLYAAATVIYAVTVSLRLAQSGNSCHTWLHVHALSPTSH